MRELTLNEIESVSGAGVLRDGYEDLKYIYHDVVRNATDFLCWATGNC